MRHLGYALIAVTLSTPALAQGSPRGDDRESWRDDRGYSYRAPDDMPAPRMRHRHFERREGGGASFFLRSGDVQLNVKCDERESMRACVEAAMIMFDKVRTERTSIEPQMQSR